MATHSDNHPWKIPWTEEDIPLAVLLLLLLFDL